jgi:pyruvate,water dikinase
MQSGMMIVYQLMFEPGGVKSEDKVVRGLGVFPGNYEGTARLIDDISDVEKIEEGDVMVARTTAPSFNVFLPLIGAVVTDRGGLLSHAAIVAREYGLPAVVGCGDATERLSDGMRVRVDGEKGEVWIID